MTQIGEAPYRLDSSVEDIVLIEDHFAIIGEVQIDFEILIPEYEESKFIEKGDYDSQGLKTGLWFLYQQLSNGNTVNTGFGFYTNDRRTGRWILIDPITNEVSEVIYN